MFAAKLAAAGKSVVVLEAGPAWQTTADLISSQIWARRLKWGGSPVLGKGNTTIGYTMNSGWGYGGAALHHFALWPRLHAEDFKLKSLYGKGLDWPMDYETLRPYYDFIQKEVGLSGDAEAEIWRHPGDPYPMKPLASSPQADIIAERIQPARFQYRALARSHQFRNGTTAAHPVYTMVGAMPAARSMPWRTRLQSINPGPNKPGPYSAAAAR